MGSTVESEIWRGVRRLQFVRRLKARLLIGWLVACAPACLVLYFLLGDLAAGWALAGYVTAAVAVVLWEASLGCPRCGNSLEGLQGLTGLARESERLCRHCSLPLVW